MTRKTKRMNWPKAGWVPLSLVLLHAAPAAATSGPHTLADALEGGSLHRDATGDGSVTDLDVAVQILDLLAPGSYGDLDGDGVVSANDTIVAIERIVSASFADVDQNGTVMLDDMLLVASRIGAPAVAGFDVDASGGTDAADVFEAGGKLGTSMRRPHDLAYRIYEFVGEVQAAGVEGLLEDEATIFAAPKVHHTEISDSWYVPESDHTTNLSKHWPPNHRLRTSSDWRRDGHDAPTSKKQQWPPNHYAEASKTWTDEDAIIDHGASLSEQHPGEHTAVFSDRWKNTPGHVWVVSRTWPTDPLDHDPVDSRKWPPNHLEQHSRLDLPISDHREELSWSWPGNHTASRSNVWPPNHAEMNSDSWGGHLLDWSYTWPANHGQSVSAEWPPDSYPRLYPPNHLFDRSKHDYGQPGPWEQTFPDGHDRWTSVKDILDLPWDLMPTKWWSGINEPEIRPADPHAEVPIHPPGELEPGVAGN